MRRRLMRGVERLLGAGAFLILPQIFIGPNPFVPLCEPTYFIFHSLRYGDFDYCRLHLRYVPGQYDCLRIQVPNCNVFLPGAARPNIRTPEDLVLYGNADLIACPAGNPPPSCPAGFPQTPLPIPRP